MKLKIIHVIHWPISGISSLLANMLPLFNQQLFENHVVFFESNQDVLRKFQEITASATSLSFSRMPIKAIARYSHLVKRLSPDVLHTHSFQPGSWGRVLFSRFRFKYVSTIHNVYPYFFDHAIRSRLKRTIEIVSIRQSRTKVICVSESVKSALRQLLPNYPMAVIENGIPLDIKDYSGFSRRSRNGKENVRIITLGRLDYQKGFDILLRAFSLVTQEFDNVELVILGEGTERNTLVSLAEQLNVKDKVRFLGYKKNPYPYLADSDIYVCSSRYEGLPLSVAEAMVSHLAVVSTRVGGVPSMIKNGDTGLLVDSEDYLSLASCIKILIADPDLRMRIAHKGAIYARKKYDIRTTVRKYEKVYLEVTSSCNR